MGNNNFLDYIPQFRKNIVFQNDTIIIKRNSLADKFFHLLLKRPVKSTIKIDKQSSHVISKIDGKKDLYEIFNIVANKNNDSKEINAFCEFINIITQHGIIKLNKKKRS